MRVCCWNSVALVELDASRPLRYGRMNVMCVCTTAIFRIGEIVAVVVYGDIY